MCFSRRRVISYFDAPPSHLYGSKQPLRRDLSNGRRTPHVAHELVKQSFLNEGPVLETNGEAFCKSEQICASTSVRQQNKHLFYNTFCGNTRLQRVLRPQRAFHGSADINAGNRHWSCRSYSRAYICMAVWRQLRGTAVFLSAAQTRTHCLTI